MFKKILISLIILFLFCGCTNQEDVQEEAVVPITIDFETITNIDYQWDRFYEENGLKHYDDGTYTSKIGIDISEFQENIDWDKLKENNLDFIYIRVARRGASTGEIHDDEKFEEHYAAAKAIGVNIGVYFFSQAINQEEAIEEADYLLEKIKDKEIDLPIVYDIENTYIEDNRINDLDKKTLTENAIAFCEEIEKNNKMAMIYTYPYWARVSYDMEKLKDYPLWLACYEDDFSEIDYPVTIWQYTESGDLNGIDGDIDIDLMFVKK